MSRKIEIESLQIKIESIKDELLRLKMNNKSDTLASNFRKIGNENFVSDWLAFLLDPNFFGNNEPLSEMFSILDNKDYDIDFDDEITVDREFNFYNGTRIDILIETSELIIAIENKIHATKGENQLPDYADGLENYGERKGKPSLKIFLVPEHNQDAVDGGFQRITYNDLYEAFKEIEVDFTQNMRSAFLLNDFKKYVREYIMKNNTLDWNSISFIEKNSRVVTKINELGRDTKKELKEYFERELSEVKSSFDEEWQIKIPSGLGYIQLFKPEWEKHLLHYELLCQDDKSILPLKYTLVLHYEKDKGKRTQEIEDKFYKLSEQECFKKEYTLSYNSKDAFGESAREMFKSLQEAVEKTEKDVQEFYKSLV